MHPNPPTRQIGFHIRKTQHCSAEQPLDWEHASDASDVSPNPSNKHSDAAKSATHVNVVWLPLSFDGTTATVDVAVAGNGCVGVGVVGVWVAAQHSAAVHRTSAHVVVVVVAFVADDALVVVLFGAEKPANALQFTGSESHVGIDGTAREGEGV